MIQLRWLLKTRIVRVPGNVDGTIPYEQEEEYKVLQYREYSDGWLDWRDVPEETED